MEPTLSAEQVADRLGVRIETVYAYVSRGLLHRAAPDGRTSRFRADEVEQLARRGRPRKGHERIGGVDVVLSTSITRIADGRLDYRGQDVTVLAGTVGFEQVAELLWTGDLPAPTPVRWSCDERALATARRAVATLGHDAPLPDRLPVALAAAAARTPMRVDLRASAVASAGRSILSTLPGVLTARPTGTVAAKLWSGMSPLAATAARVALLDRALVLLADHELATSTLAARVAASTRADPFAVVAAGLAAVSGPLHGSAGALMVRVLDDARQTGSPERAVAALADEVRDGRALAGFGHPLYPSGDPRAADLLGALADVLPRTIAARIAAVGDAASQLSGRAPNIDFALAALAHGASMPPQACEVIFAIARTAGWLAHAIEEYAEAPLRFRARALYRR